MNPIPVCFPTRYRLHEYNKEQKLNEVGGKCLKLKMQEKYKTENTENQTCSQVSSEFSGIPVPYIGKPLAPLSAEAESLLYHDPSRFGFISVVSIDKDRHTCQRSFPLSKHHEVFDPEGDIWKSFQPDQNNIYLSQATFIGPRRRIVELKEVQLAFLDIDSYNLPWGKDIKELADRFLFFCGVTDVPYPSIIVFSGRGLQAKWIFEKPIPRAALPRWKALQKELFSRFEEYGADQMSCDAARVLRVPGTVNTKNGKTCRVVYENRDENGKIVAFDFEYLTELLPKPRPEKKKVLIRAPKKETSTATGYGLETLHWAFLEDLRTILEIRGGIEEGMRSRFLMMMLSYLALSNQIEVKNFYAEAQCLAHKIDPTWSYHSDAFRTLYNKFKAHLNGDRVEWEGQKKTPIYTPSASTLIEWFKITEEEQRQLKVIHSEAIRREFNAAKQMAWQREKGRPSREEYDRKRTESKGFNAEAIKRLSKGGFSQQDIAEKLGISQGYVSRLLKKEKNITGA